MKKNLFVLVFIFIICSYTKGQVICIFCYDQNAPISTPVNNLLYNGSFETGCLTNEYFCTSCLNSSCYFSPWTSTGGGTLTYARAVDNSFSVIPNGLQAAYFGNFSSNSCSAIQFDTLCLSTVDCEVTGIPAGYPNNFNTGYGGSTGVSLEQTVAGLTVGNVYVLEFWAGGEWDNGSFTEMGLFAVDLGFGNIFLRDKVTQPSTGIGTRYIVVFQATSSNHTIKFTNWGHTCYECTELILDDVRLYTLAELSASVPSCFTGLNSFDEYVTENIYPNPITNELIVKTNNPELSEIILYDIASNVLLQSKFTYAVSLNTEQLAKGIYIYEVRNINGIIEKGKVVKN